jgi:hypothetical protein
VVVWGDLHSLPEQGDRGVEVFEVACPLVVPDQGDRASSGVGGGLASGRVTCVTCGGGEVAADRFGNQVGCDR